MWDRCLKYYSSKYIDIVLASNITIYINKFTQLNIFVPFSDYNVITYHSYS